MKIRINGHSIEIFDGATVGDAILAYSEKSFRLMMDGKLIISDRFGHSTDPSGELIEGEDLYLKNNPS